MKNHKEIAYFGYLPKRGDAIGGGEVKTRSVLEELRRHGYADSIQTFNTCGWKRNIIPLAVALLYALLFCDVIIIVSGTPQFLLILRFISVLNRLCRTDIHFIPVGDCKVSYFKEKDKQRVRRLKGIYVQTGSMRRMLSEAGIEPVCVMHNFKSIRTFCQEYHKGENEPFRFCYFARVSEVKGILETIKVFAELNRGQLCCCLDIYGKIDDGLRERFLSLVAEHETFIQYKGNASPDKSSEYLKDYFMMVFPTKFEGEGFPGSLIDAFAAGLPVLSSRFRYFGDILEENRTSLSFAFNDYDEMKLKLEYAMEHQDEIRACSHELSLTNSEV